VAVTGRLRLNEWTTPDGERRSKLQVVADDVAFLDKPKTTENGDREEIPGRPAVGN
jgi:single-strand DNA-binding protein